MMLKMKWYDKLFYTLLIIILSPLILLIMFFRLILMPFLAILSRISYKKSAYYNEFKKPFSKKVFHSSEYNFYNYAMDQGIKIKYIKQESNSLEYFIYENKIFIFPDFSELIYNEEKQYWEVVYRKYTEVSYRPLEEYINNKISLFEEPVDLPLKLLVSREHFSEIDVDLSNLPETLYFMRDYNSIFQNENSDSLSIIPQTTKDLYEMMLKNDRLGGKFELVDDSIEWTLDNVIYNVGIGYFGVAKNGKFKSEITHWHPDNFEIYDQICRVGEKGNILIIKNFLVGSAVLYMGPKEKCTIKMRKFHLGKLYVFESR